MRHILAALIAAAGLPFAIAFDSGVPDNQRQVTRPVSGTAVHFFTTALIHSQKSTAAGMIQRSTDIIELSGDLKGRVCTTPPLFSTSSKARWSTRETRCSRGRCSDPRRSCSMTTNSASRWT